jgi:hypothetical protein
MLKIDEVAGRTVAKIIFHDDLGVAVHFEDGYAFAVVVDSGHSNASFEAVTEPVTWAGVGLELCSELAYDMEQSRLARSARAKKGAATRRSKQATFDRLKREGYR